MFYIILLSFQTQWVLSTYYTSQLRLANFQVLSRHMWLEAIRGDSTDLSLSVPSSRNMEMGSKLCLIVGSGLYLPLTLPQLNVEV